MNLLTVIPVAITLLTISLCAYGAQFKPGKYWVVKGKDELWRVRSDRPFLASLFHSRYVQNNRGFNFRTPNKDEAEQVAIECNNGLMQ